MNILGHKAFICRIISLGESLSSGIIESEAFVRPFMHIAKALAGRWYSELDCPEHI